MFKSALFAAAFAAMSNADEQITATPTLIDASIDNFFESIIEENRESFIQSIIEENKAIADARNDDDPYAVTIEQTGSYQNFVMYSADTYPDPEEICTGCVQKFVIAGWYNYEDLTIDHVNFKCYLSNLPDVAVYQSNTPCDSGASKPDLGYCPPVPDIGEEWVASFNFEVPSVAPDLEYHVVVEGLKKVGTLSYETLWTAESYFRIRV